MNSISTKFSVALTHPHQFGVGRPGETVPVCVVSWTETGGQHEFQFCAEETHAQTRDQIAEIVRSAVDPPQDVGTTSNGGAVQWERVREALAKAGLAVLDTGGSEAHFEFDIDMDTGQIVGRSPTSDPPIGDLGESMATAVQRAFDGGIQEVAAHVGQAVETGEHVDAARCLLDGVRTRLFIARRHATLLCEPARRIDLNSLDPSLRLDILWLRCNLADAAHQFDSRLSGDIERLLGEFAPGVSQAARANFDLARGLIWMREGRSETALAVFGAVASCADATEGTRAWAYRNLSLHHDAANPRSAECARLSADLFLAAGDRKEAAKSLRRYAKCLLADSPDLAVNALDDVLAWTAGDDVGVVAFRASVLHVRANALLRLGRAEASLADAREAVRLRKGLHGSLPEYTASLALAAMAASAANDPALDDIKREHQAARARCRKDEHAIQLRLADLVGQYDPVEVESIRSAARASGDWKVEAWAYLSSSIHAPDSVSRIENAERALHLMTTHNAGDDDLSIGHFALGQALLDAGMKERAVFHYQETLRHDPLNSDARQNFVALLAESKRWSEMEAFLEREIDRHGEKPGLLTAHGRALLNLGKPMHAVQAARRALSSLRPADPAFDAASKLQEDALDALGTGGTVEPIRRMPPVIQAVTSDEFAACLESFRSQISGEQRMGFWRKDASQHQWIQSPEKRAQELLHIAISMSLGRERLDVFEEVGAGAGRIDLFVSGGPTFRCIVELKMLGKPYDTGYAFRGKEQIAHYMESRRAYLGYLVIIDGRTRENGKGLNATETVGRSTVRVIFVDVRPTVLPSP